MEKFIKHVGTGVPLRRSNVDTDQIIPAVYLKRVTRSGFEDGLFSAWRSDPEFVLNLDAIKNIVPESLATQIGQAQFELRKYATAFNRIKLQTSYSKEDINRSVAIQNELIEKYKKHFTKKLKI